MGLFFKELRDYKIMERYRKSLDPFFVLGETEKYRLFMDKKLKQYIVRQEKQNPKKVVYLGWIRGNHCIFHDRLFYINSISYTGNSENPLNYIDIDSGNGGKMNVLSNKGCWFAMHWHCQDTVNKFGVEQDSLVLDITRYKENSHGEKEFTYSASITYDSGNFRLDYTYPDFVVKKQKRSENIVKDPEIKVSLSSVDEIVEKKPGLIYGDDVTLQ